MAALICTIEMRAGSHLTFHRLTYFYFLHYYGDDQLGEAGLVRRKMKIFRLTK